MFNEKPKVSVCIPNYNCAKFIGKAIQSVLNQTFTDFELIIVDNCSTDNSEEVIKSFSDPRIRFYKNETNIGMTRNWNRCISLARGEYISILCSDDAYMPRFLEKTTVMLDSNLRVGMAYTACSIIDDESCAIETFRPWKNGAVQNGCEAFRKIVWSNFVALSGAIFRKECFGILGGFDESLTYAPDWEMVARVSLHYDLAYTPEILSCYRRHAANLTNDFVKSRLKNVEGHKAIEKMLSDIPPGSELEPLKSKAKKLKANYTMNNVLESVYAGDAIGARLYIAQALSLAPSMVFDARILFLLATTLLGKKTITLVSFIKRIKKMK